MKKSVVILGIFIFSWIVLSQQSQAQTTTQSQNPSNPKPRFNNKPKYVKGPVSPGAVPAVKKPKTLAPPPSAQEVAKSLTVKEEAPAVILPPMGDYKYEINIAPLAILANWYTLDFLKYDPSTEGDPERTQFGYGISAISFIRNNNNLDGTFPNRGGYGAGATAVWDHREFYYATHAYYEKFERYQDEGTLVQEREGFRANVVMGLKEVIKRRFALKFGGGIEVQTYKVREFHETNRFVQTNYQTNILNPFLECKLAMYF